MVTTRRNTSSSYFGKIPDFFKVYLPESSSQRMILPPAVTTHMNRADFSFTATIRNVGNNKLWRVGIRKVGEYIAFEQGWPVFVRDNSLKYGYFLIFSYHGSSEFHVKVYGQNQCQMRYPVAASEESDEEIMSEGNEGQNLELGKPFFELVVKKSHVAYGPVTITTSFVKKYMQKEEPISCLLKCANNTYTVKFNYMNNQLVFNGGWHIFARQNSLKIGQICKFELIPGRGYTFHVSILAANSNHPNFRIRLGESHLKKGFMFIPKGFVSKHMQGSIKTAVLNYLNQQWRVVLTGRRYSFGTGLGAFLKKNNLQIGNIFQFELIEKGDEYMFKVSLCT